ncbi:MAG: metalloregulator ArsR/SmtB family transcription factor [Candidatus Lokiarchaeota archaeon]|nr:metalloregulator ArsR/SmtB family transcription factor [Candidatus Lokiarchaeota archaeon]MBD3199192.1 metalloregulator ArsR/SmtB family transcription factor [Candidatus Lokiarchaeota archaeon]
MSDYIRSEVIELLKILSDETRLAIINSIHTRNRSSSELQKELDKSQATISKHLSILEKSNLVKSNKKGRVKFYQPKNQRIFKLLSNITKFILRQKKDERDRIEDMKIHDTLNY